jgi:hypothetical protein
VLGAPANEAEGATRASAALLLWPATTALGDLVLTIVSIGAAAAQILLLHEDVIHAIVMAILLGAIA